MNEIRELYEKKFNASESNIKVDRSWIRYHDNENNVIYKRYSYCILHLYGNVLDVGSGDGFGAYLMSKNKNIQHIVCIEIQDKAIKEARKNLKDVKNVEIIKGIGEQINYPDNSFDSVFCGETLEHVFNDEAVIKEIHRITKDLAVFSIPIKGGISLQHIREYKSEKEFEFLIKKYFIITENKSFIDDKNIKRLVIICKKI